MKAAALKMPDREQQYLVPGQRIAQALTLLRDRYADITVAQALCFFYVAANPGITQAKLWALMGTGDSVASRTVAILADIGVRNTRPLGLIEMRPNPEDRREKLLRLTPKGMRLMDEIVAALGMDRR